MGGAARDLWPGAAGVRSSPWPRAGGGGDRRGVGVAGRPRLGRRAGQRRRRTGSGAAGRRAARRAAESASTALSTSSRASSGSSGAGSQKPPRALREPGAMPLKVRPSGAGRVPTSSAPTAWPRASRHRKTAFWRASAYSRPWRWQSSSSGEAALGAQEIAHGRPEALVGWRQAELGGRHARGAGGTGGVQADALLLEERISPSPAMSCRMRSRRASRAGMGSDKGAFYPQVYSTGGIPSANRLAAKMFSSDQREITAMSYTPTSSTMCTDAFPSLHF